MRYFALLLARLPTVIEYSSGGQNEWCHSREEPSCVPAIKKFKKASKKSTAQFLKLVLKSLNHGP
jgi:hypothetical protein